MARKPSTQKPSQKPDANPMARILDAALHEVAAKGWQHLSLEAVARRAEMSLGDVLIHVPTTAHILARFADHLDRAALSNVKDVDHSQSVRDRLFDLLMRRFDALQAHRAGVVALMTGVMREPGDLAMLMARLSRSMTATLSAAGLAPYGLRGLAQIMGLKAVYLSALRVWQKDESADMAKVMAALDRSLGYAERAAQFSLSRFAQSRAAPEKAPPRN